MIDEIKVKKPIWKRWWLWIIVIFVIILITPAGEEKKETEPEQQLPQEQSQPQETSQISQEEQKELVEKPAVSDQEAMALIKTTLEAFGISDVTTTITDGRERGGVKALNLGYRSTALTETELAREMAHILGAYTAIVKNGWDIDELLVVTHGTAVRIWYCNKEWTDSFTKGEITKEELMLKVMGSMTSF